MEANVVHWVITIITIVAGGSGVAGIIVAINSRKKNKADAVKTIEEATSSLIDHYRRDNAELRKEYELMEEHMEQLTKELRQIKIKLANLEELHKKMVQRSLDIIERLVHQIKSRGDVPVCGPEMLMDGK